MSNPQQGHDQPGPSEHTDPCLLPEPVGGRTEGYPPAVPLGREGGVNARSAFPISKLPYGKPLGILCLKVHKFNRLNRSLVSVQNKLGGKTAYSVVHQSLCGKWFKKPSGYPRIPPKKSGWAEKWNKGRRRTGRVLPAGLVGKRRPIGTSCQKEVFMMASEGKMCRTYGKRYGNRVFCLVSPS